MKGGNHMEIIVKADYEFYEQSMCGCQVVDDNGVCHQTDQNN